MSVNEQGMLDPTQRIDPWLFLDKALYDVDYIAYSEAQVWINKNARMSWDAQRREFVGENHRVPVDQVSQAVKC